MGGDGLGWGRGWVGNEGKKNASTYGREAECRAKVSREGCNCVSLSAELISSLNTTVWCDGLVLWRTVQGKVLYLLEQSWGKRGWRRGKCEPNKRKN